MRRSVLVLSLSLLSAILAGCGGGSSSSPTTPTAPSPPPSGSSIASDADLFGLVTQREPFGAYAPFPGVVGIMPGTGPHQPSIRVSLNARAAGVLQNGRLPAGTRFPDGSVIFKEIFNSAGNVATYAVMYKASGDARAGNGWLWAEFAPNGNVGYSISNRGSVCTACHMLDRGPQNDFVRIFERQR